MRARARAIIQPSEQDWVKVAIFLQFSYFRICRFRSFDKRRTPSVYICIYPDCVCVLVSLYRYGYNLRCRVINHRKPTSSSEVKDAGVAKSFLSPPFIRSESKRDVTNLKLPDGINATN